MEFIARDIQAGYAQLVPSIGNSVPPLPCTLNACPIMGVNINKVGAPNSKNYFYVTGYYFDPAFGVRRLLIMKIGMNGGVLWARTNILAGAAVYDEAGVSVESCPNGDVIAISEVFNGGVYYPAATRIDIAGNLRWRFHYSPGADEQPYNFLPHQSCIYKENVPNVLPSPTGVTITGECSNPAVAGMPPTFCAMRIGYNGQMIWKFHYPLVLPQGSRDVGWDIIPEAEAVGAGGIVDNFIITGLTNPSGTGPIPGALGFLARISATTGAFVNCIRFGIPGGMPPTQTTYGQSVFQSSSAPGNVVVCGGTDDPPSGILDDTYLLEMNIITGAQISAHHYPLTTPNYPFTESVITVGGGFPTPGFFISTNSFNTYGATNEDGHVIKTDIVGRVNSANCHSDTVIFSHDNVQANAVGRCTFQHCDVVDYKDMTMKKLDAPHVICWSPIKATDEESTLAFDDSEITVYPNPASGNDVTISFDFNEGNVYSIQIINETGTIVQTLRNISNDEGQVSIGHLPEGIYMVRLFNGERIAHTKFVRLK